MGKKTAKHIKITTALTNKHWCFALLHSLSIAIVVFLELIFAAGVSHFQTHNNMCIYIFIFQWQASVAGFSFFQKLFNSQAIRWLVGWLICWARISHMYFDPKSSSLIHRPYRIAFYLPPFLSLTIATSLSPIRSPYLSDLFHFLFFSFFLVQ